MTTLEIQTLLALAAPAGGAVLKVRLTAARWTVAISTPTNGAWTSHGPTLEAALAEIGTAIADTDPDPCLPADWRCPRCKVSVAAIDGSAVTCVNGHVSF